MLDHVRVDDLNILFSRRFVLLFLVFQIVTVRFPKQLRSNMSIQYNSFGVFNIFVFIVICFTFLDNSKEV